MKEIYPSQSTDLIKLLVNIFNQSTFWVREDCKKQKQSQNQQALLNPNYNL